MDRSDLRIKPSFDCRCALSRVPEGQTIHGSLNVDIATQTQTKQQKQGQCAQQNGIDVPYLVKPSPCARSKRTWTKTLREVRWPKSRGLRGNTTR